MEEAAFFGNEMLTSVFPMLSVEGRSLLCISSVLDEDNYYSVVMKTAEKLESFLVLRVGLACDACVQEQRSTKCSHKTVRLPSWKSRERQDDVSVLMKSLGSYDREVLGIIGSENVSFVFRSYIPSFTAAPRARVKHSPQRIYMAIDPSGGGAQSDYAVLTGYYEHATFVVRYACRGAA